MPKLDELKAWLESDDGKRAIESAVESAEIRAKKREKARRVSKKTQDEPCTI
jgi:hypothetical protein